MTRRRKVTNPLALAVLSYLSHRPMHPYELSRTMRDNDDARSIKFTHGSLYMVVRQLVKARFIEPHETLREGQRPERTTYRITAAGREEMRDWLRELLAEPQHEYPGFVTALSLLAALDPAEAVALLRQRLRRLASQRAEIRTLIDDTLGTGVHPLFLIEEEYRLVLLDAEVAFAEQLINWVDDPDAGWAAQWAEFHQNSSSTHEG